MAYLAVAVALVGAICLLDLLLTVGVIRRLRDHTQILDATGRPQMRPRSGDTVADFAVQDTRGRPITRDLLEPGTLVGFFTTGCAPCKEQVPHFLEYAASLDGRSEAVAVVAAPAPDEELIAQLGQVARVVVELPDGPTVRAFDVSGFPTLVVLGGGGTVAAAANNMVSVRRLASSAA